MFAQRELLHVPNRRGKREEDAPVIVVASGCRVGNPHAPIVVKNEHRRQGDRIVFGCKGRWVVNEQERPDVSDYRRVVVGADPDPLCVERFGKRRARLDGQEPNAKRITARDKLGFGRRYRIGRRFVNDDSAIRRQVLWGNREPLSFL